MKARPSFLLTALTLSASALSSLFSTSAQAQTTPAPYWADEFNTTAFNSADKWVVDGPNRILQGTEFAATPTIVRETDSKGVVTSFARLKLSTYNPTAKYTGVYSQGTQIGTRSHFSPGVGGIEIAYRARVVGAKRGSIAGLFVYNQHGPYPEGYHKNEIDWELLNNFGANSLWTNTWNNWTDDEGSNNGITNRTAQLTLNGFSRFNWNTYRIRWYSNRIEWWINNTLVRTETNIISNDPQEIRLNIWAASTIWPNAYDAAQNPVKTAASNSDTYLDVDWVHATKLPAPTKGVWGNGDGLKTQFFNNTTLSNAVYTMRRPLINDNWSTWGPVSAVGYDKFSARWTGYIASPFTENVTFVLRADDGVRLKLNNVTKIDDFTKPNFEKERDVTVAMTAGQKIPITVEYMENTGNASVRLWWKSPSMPLAPVPTSQLWSPDTTPPKVAITSPATGKTFTSAPVIKGTASDVFDKAITSSPLEFTTSDVAGVWVIVQRTSDGLYWNGVSGFSSSAVEVLADGVNDWRLSLVGLSDGTYKLTPRARDGAGNLTNGSAITLTLDTTPPVLAITAPTTATVSAPITKATGTVTDAGTGVKSLTATIRRQSDGFYWNGTAAISTLTNLKVTYTSAGAWSLALPSTKDDTFTLSLTATDGVAKTTTKSVKWTQKTPVADTTPPTVSLYSPRANATYTTKGLPLVQFGSSDKTTGIASGDIALYNRDTARWWNGLTWQPAYTTVPVVLTPNGTTLITGFPSSISANWKLPALTANRYSLRAETVDGAGNIARTDYNQFTITSSTTATKSQPSAHGS